MQTFFKLFLLWACVAPCLHAQSNLTATFDKLLAAEFKSNHPGAMVMVAKKGQVIYQKAFGLANVELNVPVSDSTIFYIASNTKQFTAVAILQLLEKGKLKLQDTLGQFIPNCPKKLSGISIQHLLSHTSGFADENTPNVEKITLDVAGVKSILLGFKPGTKWQYNNNNYALLGYIIETLSGQSYGDYLSENIFKPAGMINSYVDKELVIVKNRASGYTHFNNGLRNVNIPEKIGASGGMQSTVGDLLKWNRALQAGKLLKPETLKLAFTPQRLLDGQVTNYGFGWRLEELQGSPTHRHGGLLPGHTSETLYLPNEDVYVVMLLNSESPRIPTVALARILASWAIDKPYSFTKVALDPNSFTKWTGLYENKFGELLNISTQNGQLTFQRPNGALYTLNYAGNNDFFLDRDFLTVNFIPNAAGQINSLQFGQVGIGATEWLRTKRPLLKLAAQRLAEPLLKQYTGKYYLPNQDTLFISGGGFGFYCQIGKQEKHLLAAEDDTHFFGLKENIHLEFVTEPTNKKAELWLMWNQQRKKYTKL